MTPAMPQPELALVADAGKPAEKVRHGFRPGRPDTARTSIPVKFPADQAGRLPQHAAHSTPPYCRTGRSRSAEEFRGAAAAAAACLAGAGASRRRRGAVPPRSGHDRQQRQPDAREVTQVAQQRRSGQERDVPQGGHHRHPGGSVLRIVGSSGHSHRERHRGRPAPQRQHQPWPARCPREDKQAQACGRGGHAGAQHRNTSVRCRSRGRRRAASRSSPGQTRRTSARRSIPWRPGRPRRPWRSSRFRRLR